MKEFDRVLVVGASRGIGAAVAEHLSDRTSELITVSRTPASCGKWIEADISTKSGVEVVKEAIRPRVDARRKGMRIKRAIADLSLDALLYMGGTWESNAFSSEYTFESCSDEDIERVLAVNLLAPIRLVKSLLPALRQADNPKIIFMGALSGLDNFPAREVANTASKFGLRGAVHALREELRPERIGVTVINPGNVGTPEVLEDLKQAGQPETNAIPLSDLLNIIDCVLSLSRSSCIKEIQMPAMSARGA